MVRLLLLFGADSAKKDSSGRDCPEAMTGCTMERGRGTPHQAVQPTTTSRPSLPAMRQRACHVLGFSAVDEVFFARC